MSAGRAILLLLSLVLLGGCSTTNDVVGRGPWQKRKYRPGWHVDLGGVNRPSNPDRRNDDKPQRMEARAVRPMEEPVPMVQPRTPTGLVATVEVQTSYEGNGAQDPSPEREVLLTSTHVSAFAPDRSETPQQTMDEVGSRNWNRMAIVSGIFLLILLTMILTWTSGGLFWYFLAFTLLTGLIGLLLAIKHKEQGKGIAILAIVVSLLMIGLFIAFR